MPPSLSTTPAQGADGLFTKCPQRSCIPLKPKIINSVFEDKFTFEGWVRVRSGLRYNLLSEFINLRLLLCASIRYKIRVVCGCFKILNRIGKEILKEEDD